MLKKAVTLLILTAVCIHANAQGWKFDSRVGGIQEKMANSTNAKSAVAITGPANNTAWIIKATRIRELGEAMVAKYLR